MQAEDRAKIQFCDEFSRILLIESVLVHPLLIATVEVTSPVDVPTGTTLSPQLSSSSHTTVLGLIRSPLSDLLNLPDTPLSWKKSKTGRARVLTSSESCWAILREKEEKKEIGS